MPLSRDDPRSAQAAALHATAEVLLARLEVAAVLAARAAPEERDQFAAVIRAPTRP